MSGKKSNKGFSLAETLITVAILVVLAGLVFVGINQYRKSMKQIEMDSIAKEIFISAQNHLSMAEGQGFLGINATTGFGTPDTSVLGTYYFLVNGGDAFNPATPTLLDLMLPTGAVEDTARLGGNYIIYYQKSPAIILDVFYSEETRTFGSSDCSQTSTLFTEYKGLNNKKRQNYNNKIIGWYGGTAGELAAGKMLKTPSITVQNGDKLDIEISNIDDNVINYPESYLLQLIVRGETSNKIKAIDITSTASTYTYTLDDISKTNGHFVKNSALDGFYPGENISLQAKVFSKSVLTNVATSKLAITNSLFDTNTTVDSSGNATAVISNFRHLENLSKGISNCEKKTSPAFQVTKAVQTKDLTWDSSYFAEKGIVAYNSTTSNTKFYPITTNVPIDYDGRYHSISGVVISESSGNAGVFGTLTDSSVSNLRLIDVNVAGENAGALTGSFSVTSGAEGKISNVIAYNSEDNDASFIGADKQNVSGTSNAGGLIGSMSGGTVEKSAAAVIVRSSGGNAGGLIGTATGGTISSCYSGGHAIENADGSVGYSNVNYNVTAGTNGGGLIGKADSATIEYSYSTCSVFGTSLAGGFIGNLTGGITSCYCTGLVSSSTTYFAFSGTEPTSLSGCYYYEIINELTDDYLKPYPGFVQAQHAYTGGGALRITALDHTVTIYDGFVGAKDRWKTAIPYEDKLGQYYSGKYNLKTVAQLVGSGTDYSAYFVDAHYGDWPAPEIFIINSNS